LVGADVGEVLGTGVVGSLVGAAVGASVGVPVGELVGVSVGALVGASVGSSVPDPESPEVLERPSRRNRSILVTSHGGPDRDMCKPMAWG
jgi:uncharacterized protein YcfJ